jgi:replication-associated recombination protein RarA
MATQALFAASASIPQSNLDFPAALTERYRPRVIAEFVGLDEPKKILARLAAQPFESAWRFVGPSGTGKTTMAMALAAAIPAELHHIPSQNCNLENIERVCRTCQYVPMSGFQMHLVLVDEADRMSDAAQIALLSKLDETARPPKTVFVFTCNSTDRLEARFLSRTRELEFSSYGISGDAAALLARVWEAETNGAAAPNFARIVKDSSNNVRECLMRLETKIMAI